MSDLLSFPYNHVERATPEEVSELASAYLDAFKRIRELVSALERIAHHRENCWAYDDDISGDNADRRRHFYDEEEWDRVEADAARAAEGEREKR